MRDSDRELIELLKELGKDLPDVTDNRGISYSDTFYDPWAD